MLNCQSAVGTATTVFGLLLSPPEIHVSSGCEEVYDAVFAVLAFSIVIASGIGKHIGNSKVAVWTTQLSPPHSQRTLIGTSHAPADFGWDD